jgi:Uma2 family endonuclease
MQTALSRDYISVDDYLTGEEMSEIKHEYTAGSVYAMAGASREHNRIAGNIYSAFAQHLRGGRCQAFISDIKVRLETLGDEIFYYPDIMVGCDSRDTHRLYLRFPKVLVEVSSKSTERLDRGEKRLAYQSLETLEEYMIVAQERAEITIFRRVNKWKPETVAGLDQSASFKSLDLMLPLTLIYDGVLKVES